MIVVASAGLNLPRELLTHCRIAETPHQIVVDGALHSVRSITSFATIRHWMETAKEPPYPLGSSAPEYVNLLNELVKQTNEVLIVTGTRKILGTYDAAVAATRVVASSRKGFVSRILDTGLVELGAGMVAAYCGAAALAGHSMAAVAAAGQALAEASSQLFVPHTLDYLAQGSRSDMARRLRITSDGGLPVLVLRDGMIDTQGSVAGPEQTVDQLVELLLQRYKTGRALWVSIMYADDPGPARQLLAAVRRSFEVQYAVVHHLGPAGYLFLGTSALGISAHPVDAMKLVVELPEPR